jgi:hypothetical protein
MRIARLTVLAVLAAGSAAAQSTSTDPFPTPIPATDGAITVNVAAFAQLPDIGGQAARPMLLVDEPGSRRLFVNDMRGMLYSVSYDGKTVTPYVDINAADWGVGVQSAGNERGFQSFAFHPQFARPGSRGFGKFYTFTDTTNTTATADFLPAGATGRTHDTVLLEWTAKNPAAAAYDGGPPREMIRFAQPFANHNAGQLAFNPLAGESAKDFGLLYIGFADGGSGGDPLDLAQNLGSAFGKMLRIDPLGTNSANKKYGIPAANPFVNDNNPETLGEIYAYGLRNPQRFAWDSRNSNLFVADIGQNTIEEVSIVTAGANLGWNDWEGSYAFLTAGRGRAGVPGARDNAPAAGGGDGRGAAAPGGGRGRGPTGVGIDTPRADKSVVYPVVEYAQADPLLQNQSAVTMGVVYRATAIKALANLVIFGDNPSGEIFYINADKLPNGGQDAIRRILLNDNGTPKTLLQLVQAANATQGKQPATRADLRFGWGPDNQVFLLNKRDGIIRRLMP